MRRLLLLTAALLLGAPALAQAAAPTRALIGLEHRDQAGLERFVARVSDPASPSYGHYLTPTQFEARYAPTQATVDRVRAYAASVGLKVTDVPRNRAYVAVSGPVSVLRSLPAALTSIVSGVSGLDQSKVVRPLASPPPAYVNTGPCSTAFGDTPAPGGAPQAYGKDIPAVPCGYSPQQLQSAYGVKDLIAGGLDGSGQRVAIIDAFSSPRIVQDATAWSQHNGLPAPKIEVHDSDAQRNAPEVPSLPTDVPVLGGASVFDPQGWAGEETLDVEAVHAMAPGAQIVYVGANSPLNMDLETAQNDVVANKRAQIVTNSYGGTSDDKDDVSDGIWQQAAAQGMGVYFSSGDAGDETMGGKNPNDRTVDAGANSPYVTAVGGTTLGVTAQGGYGFETYWGTFSSTLSGGAWSPAPPGEFNSGGGGGTSQSYGQPAYQKGVVDDRYAKHFPGKPAGRVVPDVAILGDPNSGFKIGLEQDFTAYGNPLGATLPTDKTGYGEYRIGGTSLSSPLFAGVMALADQAAGKPHGFANPALYKAGASAYHDVTAPSSPVAVVRTNYVNATNAKDGTETLLRTAGQTGTLTSAPGYDDSTGLGSPKGVDFLRALAPGSALLPAASSGTGTTAAGGTAAGGGSGAGSTPPATKKGKTCSRVHRYKLRAPKGQRIVAATVTVGGRSHTFRAKSLRRVTAKAPAVKTYRITITTRTNRGRRVRTVRRYSASGCKRGKVTSTVLKRRRA